MARRADPYATGRVLDHLANGYTILFGICSVAYLVTLAMNQWLAPSFEPVRFDEAAALPVVQ